MFIRRFAGEVINKKNIDAIDTLVAADLVEHVPFPGQGPGRKGLKDAIGLFLNAFSDIHWALDEQIAEGDKVMSRINRCGRRRTQCCFPEFVVWPRGRRC